VRVLAFDADGRPRSKGSRVVQKVPGQNRVRAAAVQEDDLKEWTRTIRSASTLAVSDGRRLGSWPRELWAGPVLVVARFRLVLPQRLAAELDPEPALVVPDGDKLERALWDALTGLAYADDRQVIGWAASKSYATPLEYAGVSVRVGALDSDDDRAAASVLVDRAWAVLG
jgi:Endodeoxyribonuclease RusA